MKNYSKKLGFNYEETFSLIAMLKSIKKKKKNTLIHCNTSQLEDMKNGCQGRTLD